jgi:hypothetical protein
MLLEAAWTVMFIGFYPIMAAAIERLFRSHRDRSLQASFFFYRIEQTDGGVTMVELFPAEERFRLCAPLQATMWSLSVEERRYGVSMPEVGVRR